TRRVEVDVFRLRGKPARRKAKADQRASAAATVGPWHVVFHQVIGKVGQRIAQGREFPVEDREHAWGTLGQYGVVEAEIAMNEPYRSGRRRMLWQPDDQPVHVVDGLRLRGAIRLR